MNFFWHQKLKSMTSSREDLLLNICHLHTLTDAQLTVYFAFNDVYRDHSEVLFMWCGDIVQIIIEFVDEITDEDENDFRQSVIDLEFRMWDPDGTYSDFLKWHREFVVAGKRAACIDNIASMMSAVSDAEFSSAVEESKRSFREEHDWCVQPTLLAMYIILAILIYSKFSLMVGVIYHYMVLVSFVELRGTRGALGSVLGVFQFILFKICMALALVQRMGVENFGTCTTTFLRPFREAAIRSHDLSIQFKVLLNETEDPLKNIFIRFASQTLYNFISFMAM